MAGYRDKFSRCDPTRLPKGRSAQSVSTLWSGSGSARASQAYSSIFSAAPAAAAFARAHSRTSGSRSQPIKRWAEPAASRSTGSVRQAGVVGDWVRQPLPDRRVGDGSAEVKGGVSAGGEQGAHSRDLGQQDSKVLVAQERLGPRDGKMVDEVDDEDRLQQEEGA